LILWRGGFADDQIEGAGPAQQINAGVGITR